MEMSTQINKQRSRRLFFLIVIAISAITIFLVWEEPWRNDYAVLHYASVKNVPDMFYTIHDKHGNLAVIDGGNEDDLEQFVNTVRRYGSHVAVWVITNPMPEHAGVFNTLYPELGKYGISVDCVCVPADARSFPANQSTGNADVIDAFFQTVNMADHVSVLSENDEFELLPGLNMRVLLGWSQSEQSAEQNISMMFKLYGPTESMLFCSDSNAEAENAVISRHRNELKSDYVQCANHAIGSIPASFYNLVAPSTAFLDSPRTVLDSRSADLLSFFSEEQVECITFAGAPNGIILK